MTDAATYVYAVSRDLEPGFPQGLEGVGGGAVRLAAAAGLQALVSDVDRSDFETRALEERLEDLEWLAATARAHHHVVDAAGRSHVIAPLSLATVYYGDDRVREVLEVGGETFTRVLEKLHGRAEWGVKAFAKSGAASSDAGERPRSGAEYLRRRRRALHGADTAMDEAHRAAEEVHAAVAGLAVDVRTHRLQESTLTGTAERMVLNGAYLVDVTDAAHLAAVVRSFADHDRIRVELTGPWVPYSFSQVTGS